MKALRDNKSKSIIITSLVITSIFISLTSLLINLLLYTKDTPPKQSVNDSISISTEKKTSYIVKSFNGNIAVFENGTQEPFKITHICVDNLPIPDQELLSVGIEANSSLELNAILEDYCS